jgi:hypothetical protein
VAADPVVEAPAPTPVEPPQPEPPKAEDKPADPVELESPEVIAQKAIDGIRDAIPDAIKEDRARRGRDFFDAVPEALQREIDPAEFADLPPPMAKAVAREFQEMALDAGATADDVGAIRAALADVTIKPPTDEQRVASREACIVAFNEAFGMEAAKVLATTRAWVAADPRRARILESVGDVPAVAVRIAQLARRQS